MKVNLRFSSIYKYLKKKPLVRVVQYSQSLGADNTMVLPRWLYRTKVGVRVICEVRVIRGNLQYIDFFVMYINY